MREKGDAVEVEGWSWIWICQFLLQISISMSALSLYSDDCDLWQRLGLAGGCGCVSVLRGVSAGSGRHSVLTSTFWPMTPTLWRPRRVWSPHWGVRERFVQFGAYI